VPQKAQAIVVLLGWWGAQPKHLDKYADLYQEILPSSTIIAGTASSQSILFKSDDQLKQFAKQGLEAIANTLADHQNLHLPIFLHVFSNGGGFVWHQMWKILEEEDDDDDDMSEFQQYNTHRNNYRHNLSTASIDTEETPLHTNTALSLMRSNIRGQIYDSAPAYPKLESGIAAFEASGMVRNRFFLIIVKCWFFLMHFFEYLWHRINNRPHRLMEYWEDLLQCDWTIPQGFIYSTMDRMVDSDHLDDFIATRTNLLQQHPTGSTPKVTILKFGDSPHVMHYRYHPEEYKEFVAQFLQNHLVTIPNRSLKL
jgi:hypothetical protein